MRISSVSTVLIQNLFIEDVCKNESRSLVWSYCCSTLNKLLDILTNFKWNSPLLKFHEQWLLSCPMRTDKPANLIGKIQNMFIANARETSRNVQSVTRASETKQINNFFQFPKTHRNDLLKLALSDTSLNQFYLLWRIFNNFLSSSKHWDLNPQRLLVT
jgi:hypothetical protein